MGYELSAGPWDLVILGYFFVPCYIKAGVKMIKNKNDSEKSSLFNFNLRYLQCQSTLNLGLVEREYAFICQFFP